MHKFLTTTAVVTAMFVGALDSEVNAGLVHHWTFDDAASSTVAVDSVGGHHGTLRGRSVGTSGSQAHLVTNGGVIGGAVRLRWVPSDQNTVAKSSRDVNTDAGHVDLADGLYQGGVGNGSNAKAVTYAGWFRFNPTPTYAEYPNAIRVRDWRVWSSHVVNAGGGQGFRVQAKTFGDKGIQMASMSEPTHPVHAVGPATANPNVAPNVQPGFDLFDGQWHHVVWTQTADDPDDHGNQTVQKIYIDGVIAANDSSSNPAASIDPDSYSTGGHNLVLGGARYYRTNGNGGPLTVGAFDGWIDDFRIYDEALGEAAVQSLYTQVPEPGTIGLLSAAGLILARRRSRANC